MANIEEVECPICYNNNITYITFKCGHKVCLNCFFEQMLFSLNKCSLCRFEVKSMNNMIEYIDHLKKYIKNLENTVINCDENIVLLLEENNKLKHKVLELEMKSGN